MRAAGIGQEANIDFWKPEVMGPTERISNVAGERELKVVAHRCSIDRGNKGDRRPCY